MDQVVTRALRDDEREWALERIREAWAEEIVVGRGRVRNPAELPGIVAEAGGERVGLATYEVEGDTCELVTMGGKRSQPQAPHREPHPGQHRKRKKRSLLEDLFDFD